MIFVKHRAPYRDPVLRVLESFGDVESRSLFTVDVRHDWAGFQADHEALMNVRRGTGILWSFVFSRKYDIVVWPAYHPWWITLPIFMSAMLGKRYGVTSDTKDENGNVFFRLIKRFLFRRAAFIWVPGHAARNYLLGQMGVPANRIVEGLFTVDRHEVSRMCEDASGKCERFLMVGNDIPGRKIGALVDGFRRWRTGKQQLIVCGKGCSKFNGGGVIGMDGVKWSDLPRMYAETDVYVHNGREQYSTAVQIAAIRGLPMICSRAVGIVADFPCPESCMVLVDDWQSSEAWTAAFARMVAKSDDERRTMGRKAKSLSAAFDVQKVVSAIREKLSI